MYFVLAVKAMSMLLLHKAYAKRTIKIGSVIKVSDGFASASNLYGATTRQSHDNEENSNKPTIYSYHFIPLLIMEMYLIKYNINTTNSQITNLMRRKKKKNFRKEQTNITRKCTKSKCVFVFTICIKVLHTVCVYLYAN